MPPRDARAAADPLASSPDLDLLGPSLRLSLLAASKASRTIETSLEALGLFDRYLEAQGMPRRIGATRREHVQAWIADLLARWKPSTAQNRFKSVQQFFKWCADEGEIPDSPMRNMSPPKVVVSRVSSCTEATGTSV